MSYQQVNWTTGDIITEAKLDQMTANDAGFNNGTAIGNGAITTAKIADLAVTASKLGVVQGCGVRLTAVQTISNMTNTAIIWNVEDWDTNNLHSTVSQQERLVIPAGQAGLYQVHFQCIWNHNSGGTYRALRIYRNGSSLSPDRYVAMAPSAVAGLNAMSLSAVLDLAAGDFITAIVMHDQGGGFNLNSAWGEIVKVGTKA